MTNKQEIQDLIEKTEEAVIGLDGGLSYLNKGYAIPILKATKKALQDYQAMLERVEDSEGLTSFLYSITHNIPCDDMAEAIQNYIRGEND